MTTLVAVHKGKQLCLASDSLTLWGSRKEVDGTHVCGTGKMLRIGNAYIGMAGHPSWELILTHYLLTQHSLPEWKTSDEVYAFFRDFHSTLEHTYYLEENSSFPPFKGSHLELLMINPHGIFEVDYIRTVRHYTQFSALGTGEEYALGAMRAVYDTLDSAVDIAGVGIAAAAEFDRKTSLPMHVRVLP